MNKSGLKLISLLLVGQLLFVHPTLAFTGAATIPYLIKLCAEAVRQYQQLRMILQQARDTEALIKNINDGLDNALNLMQSLPIKDERILADLQNFKLAFSEIQKLYGMIPKGPEAEMLALHDQTIAESLKIINDLKKYAEQQEKNANRFQDQSYNTSPKGAARMNTQVNAQILHSLNQLIRVNGQMLKMQSEQLGMENKGAKEAAYHYQQVGSDLKSSLRSFNGNFETPRFN